MEERSAGRKPIEEVVGMESGELFCYNHPKRATGLRCNRCDRPICAQCAVLTPVGYRCKACVQEQRKVFENARWYDYPVAFAACGAITGLGAAISMYLGWFGILLAVFTGFAAERVMNWAVHYRRSRYLWWAGVAGVVGSMLVVGIALLVFIFSMLAGGAGAGIVGLVMAAGPMIIYVIITLVVFIGRLNGRW